MDALPKNNQLKMKSIFYPEKGIFPICPKCKNFPKLKITDKNPALLKINCSCSYNAEIPTKQYISFLNESNPSREKCHSHTTKIGDQYCNDCQKWLCIECIKNHQIEKKAHLLSLTQINFDFFCSLHKNNENEYYCITCQKHFCNTCLPSHKTHEYKNMTKEYEEYLNDKDMKAYVKSITKAERYINDYNKKLKDDVIKILRELIEKIENSYKKNYEINKSIILLSKYLLNTRNETNCVNFNILYNIVNNINFKFDKAQSFNYEESSRNNINILISHYDKAFVYEKVDDPFASTNKIVIQPPKNKRINKFFTLNNVSTKVTSLSALKDGRLAVSSESCIRIFDLGVKKCSLSIENEHEQAIEYITQIDNGLLASCSLDKTIKLFSIEETKYTTEAILVGHQYRVTKVESINEEVIASSSFDHSIKIWKSIPPYEEIKTMTGHQDGVFSIVKLKGKNQLVSGSSDIRFWNLDSYQCEAVIKGVNCFFPDSILELDNNRIIVGEKIVTSIINAKTFQIEKKIKENLFRITSFAGLDETGYFVCANKIGNIFYMESDFGNIKCVDKIEKATNGTVIMVANIGNGLFASVEKGNKVIYIWNIE